MQLGDGTKKAGTRTISPARRKSEAWDEIRSDVREKGYLFDPAELASLELQMAAVSAATQLGDGVVAKRRLITLQADKNRLLWKRSQALQQRLGTQDEPDTNSPTEADARAVGYPPCHTFSVDATIELKHLIYQLSGRLQAGANLIPCVLANLGVGVGALLQVWYASLAQSGSLVIEGPLCS